jgi:hypothetical protein
MRRSGWRVGTASAVVVTALALAGCNADHSAQQPRAGTTANGTGSGSTSAPKATAPTPLEAVRLAAAHASKASTAHVAGRISVTQSGQRTTIRLVADEQWRPSLRMRYTMSGLGALGEGVGTIRAVMTGNAFYMSFRQLRSQLGKDWVKIRFADMSKATGLDLTSMLDQARQFDPSESLKMLGTAGSIRKVGTGTVGGVPTTRYAGDVDVAAAMRRLSAGSPQLRHGLDRMGLKREHVEAWIDGAGQLRRMITTAAGKGMSMRVDMVVSRYGEPVHVTAPPASDTVDLHDMVAGSKG